VTSGEWKVPEFRHRIEWISCADHPSRNRPR